MDSWRLAGAEVGRECILRTAVPKQPCHVDQPVVKLSTTCYRNTEIRHQMAAPAVCADKEDSPGVAHFRPLQFSAVTHTLSPSRPSLSRFLGARGSPGPEKRFCPQGIRAGADSAGNRCVLVAVRGDVPTSDRLILCPAGVSWPPDLPVCPGRRPRRCLWVPKCGPSHRS